LVVQHGRREPQAELAVLALAVALDALAGEPPSRWHPVAAMGQAIAFAERHAPRAPHLALAYGALVAVGGTLACWLGTRAALRWVERRVPWFRWPLAVLVLKATFAVRALDDAAQAVARPLASGDLPTARGALRALVSRDPRALDGGLIAAAAVESVAENLADSFVAPLVWYALLGVPGAVAYRYANTCDAMLGYRGRYEYLGKAAARLDDALGWLPARLTGLALVAAAPLVGADPRAAWRTLCQQRHRTASPNAGWPMSAAAGALGVRLEKVGHYALGDGPQPDPHAIGRAVRLVRAAAALAFAAYAAGALLRNEWRGVRSESQASYALGSRSSVIAPRRPNAA
jgi:adenosylcobinamide-phosphate synthase